MTKKERLRAVLKGDNADRPPASLWRHFYLSEQQPDELAETLADFQAAYDWDFTSVTFREACYGEAWGCQYLMVI